MRKFLVFVALFGLLAIGGPVRPAAAATGVVLDADDVAKDAGDILSATAANDPTVVLRVVVKTPENPGGNPNWNNNLDTEARWFIDTNGDAVEDFAVVFFAEDGGLIGQLFGDGEAPICENTTSATFVNGGYQVSFPASCIGSPPSLRFAAEVSYDDTPSSAAETPQLDSAPDGDGWSGAVAAGVDRAVRVGVVARGDSGLYVGAGFGAGYGALGGQLIAAPAIGRVAGATQDDPAEPIYVGTGVDNQLWARTGGQGWRPLSSGGTFCKGEPGALVYTSGATQHLVVACRGRDDALWSATATITPNTVPNLTNWTRIGGILTAGPALGISQHLGDVVTYLVRGTDGAVWQSTGGGFTRTHWVCKGHAAFNTLNDVSWFGCRGADDALWVARNTPAGWAADIRLGGILAEGPGVAVTPESAVFFVPGVDNAVWQRVVRNSDGVPLTDFTSTGGQIKFGVNAVTL
ncbi:MAG: hypothetical protein QOG87_2625 [Actinomycetota bacterium]|jgi:hypothetical protein